MLNWSFNRSVTTADASDPGGPSMNDLSQIPVKAAPKRPRIALALGGGAARGWAHIGVLRALDEEGVVTAVVQALYDAADDDSATGGPDLTRRIFPVVHVITPAGGRRMSDEEVAAIADRMIASRMQRPDGPVAPLT